MQSIVKERCCNHEDGYRLAYSRPGFVTLKSRYPVSLWSSDVPRDTFVRSSGHILSKIEGESTFELVTSAFEQFDEADWEALHVWQVDSDMPGKNGFEPGITPLVSAIAHAFRTRLKERDDARASTVNTVASHNTKVIDIIIEQPNRWWIGAHRVHERHDCWPGGVPPLDLPVTMISRAYLKIAEAVEWARLPLKPNQQVVEIGSSPGGACQYFLDRGLRVTGVDPAEMDPAIMAHPKFEYVRSRAIALKRRFFSQFQYLACDANVAPNYTIDTVGAIVTHESNTCQGVVLTIKCKDPATALLESEFVNRVRDWGFQKIEARQLSYNRREFTIVLQRNA